MTRLERIMLEHGFMVMQTGGGCTAYEKVVQVLVTTVNGCVVPTTIDDPVIVGMYDIETGNTISVQHYDSIVDAFKK